MFSGEGLKEDVGEVGVDGEVGSVDESGRGMDGLAVAGVTGGVAY